jgi:hypothetical protein
MSAGASCTWALRSALPRRPFNRYAKRFLGPERDTSSEIAITRSPWQNAYAERFIGSVRRGCIDHVFVVQRDRPPAPGKALLPTTLRELGT